MKASELINDLERQIKLHGDIQVCVNAFSSFYDTKWVEYLDDDDEICIKCTYDNI